MPALGIAEVEPEIVHVEGEPPAWPKNAPGLAERPPPRVSASNHAQGAEHQQGVVESLVRQAPEPAEIRLNSQQIDSHLRWPSGPRRAASTSRGRPP